MNTCRQCGTIDTSVSGATTTQLPGAAETCHQGIAWLVSQAPLGEGRLNLLLPRLVLIGFPFRVRPFLRHSIPVLLYATALYHLALLRHRKENGCRRRSLEVKVPSNQAAMRGTANGVTEWMHGCGVRLNSLFIMCASLFVRRSTNSWATG